MQWTHNSQEVNGIIINVLWSKSFFPSHIRNTKISIHITVMEHWPCSIKFCFGKSDSFQYSFSHTCIPWTHKGVKTCYSIHLYFILYWQHRLTSQKPKQLFMYQYELSPTLFNMFCPSQFYIRCQALAFDLFV